MVKYTLILALLAIVPTIVLCQENMIIGDPTFESGIDGWQATGDAEVSLATEGALSPASLQLDVFSTNGNLANATLRSESINIDQNQWGQMLYFTFHAQQTVGEGQFRVQMQLTSDTGTETEQRSRTLPFSITFREYAMPVYLTPGTSQLQIQFQCGLQTGTFRFDDMQLVAKAVPLSEIEQFDHWESRSFVTPPSTQGAAMQSGTATASITIHPDEVIAPVLPTQFGVNSNFRSGNDLLDRTELYHSFGSFRYPAGSGSNQYFWDCEVPQDFAIPVNDICGTANQNLWPENFVTFKENAKGEATVVVNYFYARYGLTEEGTRAARVQQAADYAAGLVHYLNVELGAGIRYWEIGNECYGPWETGYEVNGSIVTGKEYGEDLRIFAEAMKAVDDQIWVGAVLSHKDFDWNNQVLREVEDHADFLIVHHYFELEDAATAAEALQDIRNDMQEIQIAAAHHTSKPPGYFPVAFTEFNIQGPPATNITNGLFVAEALATVVEHKFTMSNIWVNEWNISGFHTKGLLAQNDPNQQDYTARPSYTPFYYLDKYFGDQMVKVSLSGNENVRAYASTFSSGETGVLIVNYAATPQQIQFEFTDETTNPDSLYWHTVHGNSLEAGDMKFLVNGQTSSTPGGGPVDLDEVPAYATVFEAEKQLEVPKYSATYLVFNTSISTSTGEVEPATKPLIYPNPSTGLLTLNTNGDFEARPQLYGADGRAWSHCLTLKENAPARKVIDMSRLPDGIYFLKMDGRVEKVVKQ